MKYVIGIDGGGTKTHLKALSLQRELLGEAFGGASNLTSLSKDAVWENLKGLIDDFYANSPLVREDCIAACLGTAGYSSSAAARKELSAMLRELFPGIPTVLTNDLVPALYGGTGNGRGVILIAGTGSSCVARDEKGNVWRTGGWGHIIGDEGSGYDLSRRMLGAVMRAFDGRGEQTLLTELILHHLNLSSPMELVDYVYRSGNGKKELAALSFLGDTAYEQGDRVTQSIYEEAAGCLCEMIAVAAKRVSLTERPPVICVCTGGVAVKSRPMKNLLAQKLSQQAPKILLRECKEDAAYGSALMALEHLENGEG